MAVYGVGAYRLRLYQLAGNNIAVSGTACYPGEPAIGIQNFTLTIPDMTKVTHFGDNCILAVDYLPSREGATAEFSLAASDVNLNALLTNVVVRDIAGSSAMHWGTSQQGSEPTVGLLVYQQALDADSGERVWRSYIVPKARVIPVPTSMNENAAAVQYRVAINPSRYHLWGEEVSAAVDGATLISMTEMVTSGRPAIVGFEGDASTTTFVLSESEPIVSEDGVAVWIDGALMTTGYTVDVEDNEIVFSTAPDSGSVIVVKYEW